MNHSFISEKIGRTLLCFNIKTASVNKKGAVFMFILIQLPTLNWFQHENAYTGSYGTDPLRGCLSVTTFNYRVQLITEDNNSKIIATYYLEPPWNCKTYKREDVSKEFDGTASGIKAAEEWLLEGYKVFLNLRGNIE